MDEQNKLKELNALQSLSSSPMMLMICILTGVLTTLTAIEDFTNATSPWAIAIGIIRLTLNVLLITSLLIIYFNGKKLSLSTIGFQFFKVVFLLLFNQLLLLVLPHPSRRRTKHVSVLCSTTFFLHG